MKLVIKGKFPCLNDYISAERRNRFMAAGMKKKYQAIVSMAAREQLSDYHPQKVNMRYIWYEPTRRRDKDNISSFGRKVIQDGLVEAGILDNDGWANIEGFSDTFCVDKHNPRIEVEFEEV